MLYVNDLVIEGEHFKEVWMNLQDKSKTRVPIIENELSSHVDHLIMRFVDVVGKLIVLHLLLLALHVTQENLELRLCAFHRDESILASDTRNDA